MAGELVIKDYKDVFWLFEMGRIVDVTWTKWPVSRNSTSYRRLMLTPQGRAAFCVFNGIVRLVSRERTGGMLVMRGVEMSPEDIHTETGIPMKDVRAGLVVLTGKDIAWIITIEEQVELDKARNKAVSKTSNARPPDVLKTDQDRPPLATHASCSSSSGLDSSSGEKDKEPQRPRKNATAESDFPGFVTWWSLYPPTHRKEKRADCLRLWQRMGLEVKSQIVIEGLNRWAASQEWAKNAGAYIPGPHPWLNARRWEQNPPAAGTVKETANGRNNADQRRATQALREYPDHGTLPIAR